MSWFFKSSTDREVDGLKRVPELAQKSDVPGLIKMLRSEFSSVRDSAIKALGQIGDARAVEPLLTLFSKGDSWSERSQAAKALGAIRDPRAVDPLMAALRADPNDTVRFAAAVALGFIGDTRATKLLIETLKQRSSGNTQVEFAAADALERMKDPNAFDGLCDILTDDAAAKSDYPKRVAVKVLGKISDVRAVPVLIRVLEGPNHIISGDAAQALGIIGGDAAVDALMAALVHRGEFAAADAAKALAKIGDPRAVDALTQALNRGGIVQRTAQEALKTITSRKLG